MAPKNRNAAKPATVLHKQRRGLVSAIFRPALKPTIAICPYRLMRMFGFRWMSSCGSNAVSLRTLSSRAFGSHKMIPASSPLLSTQASNTFVLNVL